MNSVQRKDACSSFGVTVGEMTVYARKTGRGHRHPHTLSARPGADRLATRSGAHLLDARAAALDKKSQNQDEKHAGDDADDSSVIHN
jgi:hypothetical protein